ncbi:hydrolase [Rothia sp. LK2588]|uniref:DUF6882 domain-containing protein n=1 Tax=Rothia sp. LK2588 TaxID=3114369 RepID=UPI0034CEAC8C
MTKTLQDLIDESIFLSTEYQARLAELSGNSEWSVDFSAPSFTLASDSSVKLTPYLLGTESKNRGSWIWSWQELGHFPDAVVSAAVQARESGDRHNISELTTDELVLSENVARRLTLATKALTGIYAHYPVAAGAGVRAWILLEGKELELEAPTVNRMGRVMAESLKSNTIVNQQKAVDTYARMRGAHIAWDTEATAVITASDGALRLWFDEGKISGIEAAEPEVDSAELARCAQQAKSLREQLAAERKEIEQLAAREAREQIAAREEEAAAEARQREERERTERAEREAAAQRKEQERAERAQAEREEKAAQMREEEVPQNLDEKRADEEHVDEVAGVVPTDRVYPNAEAPYDQDPQRDAQPGRVTTSALSDEDVLSDDSERQAGTERRVEREETRATGSQRASSVAVSAEQDEVRETERAERIERTEGEQFREAREKRRPSAFRNAGDAPDLDAERQEAQQAPAKEKEKKGFFSRFFGL